MIKSNCKLGGEPSGHIVLSDFAKTGDGLLTAIKVLSLLKKSGQRASQFLRPFKPVPQSLKNLKDINKDILISYFINESKDYKDEKISFLEFKMRVIEQEDFLDKIFLYSEAYPLILFQRDLQI